MIKTIVVAIVALTLAGCSVTKSVVHAPIHPETSYHLDQNAQSFVQLVNTVRLNSNIKKPTMELKNQLNQLIFQAGLVPYCTKSDGCYLARPGTDTKIRIEPDYILIFSSGSYIKIEDASQAAQVIYG